MPTPAEPTPISIPSRSEWIFILCLTLAAFVLRGWDLSQVSVEHFDEAIYASNLLFGEAEGYRYPNREFFAPPLFPFLVEWTMIFTGVSGRSAMYVNVLFGSLTIPLLWFVGRTWFGPVCGCVAAIIACGYDFHIFYSRTALTDISLCFWWLLAVWTYERSFTFRSWKYAIAAGLFSGLCWATKYNGWITWLIAVTGGLGYVLFSLKSEPLGRRLKLWGMICGVSAVMMLACWYPVWSDLEDIGGYGAIAANHRGYFVGFGGWVESLLSHIKTQRAEQGLSTLAVAVFAWMWMVASVVTRRLRAGSSVSRESVDARATSTWWLTDRHVLMWLPASFVFLLVAVACSISFALGVVGLGVLAILLVAEFSSATRRGRTASIVLGEFSRAALWLLGSWTLGLLLATPLYAPYPRLLMPSLIKTWIGFGVFVVFMLANGTKFALNRRTLAASLVVTLLVVAGRYGGMRPHSRPFPAWQSRLGIEHASHRIAEAILNDTVSRKTVPAKDRAIVYVWGEPAVVFHLRAAGWPMVAPVANFGFLEPIPGAPMLPTYLVVGPHYEKDLSAGVNDLTGRFELVGKFRFTPSDLVAFDEQPPQGFAQAVPREDEPVSLFRIR
ncbi:MAG: glycosyltransferase family 39 protein [Planctomycetaceae bacterium]